MVGDGGAPDKKEIRSVEALRLFEDLYHTLHSHARSIIKTKHRLDRTGPTSLVHDAFLRLQRSQSLQIHDEHHLIALASQTMRRIVIDHAKRIRAGKNGSGSETIEFDESFVPLHRHPDELIAIDESLKQIALKNSRAAQVAELMIFGGLGVQETAALLGVNRRTIQRDVDLLGEELGKLGY